ncbi:unnamed protein product, partial [Didymodactylos carnosus]
SIFDLQISINYYFESDTYNLLVFHIDYKQDEKHISLFKHTILNACVNSMSKTTINFVFDNWETTVIDDLNENYLIPKELLEDGTYHSFIKYQNKNVSIFDNIYDDLMILNLSKIVYNIPITYRIDINSRKNYLLDNFEHRKTHLSRLFQNKLNHYLLNNNGINRDWRKELLSNILINAEATSFLDGLYSIFSNIYENIHLRLLHTLEKYALFDIYFKLFDETNQILKIVHVVQRCSDLVGRSHGLSFGSNTDPKWEELAATWGPDLLSPEYFVKQPKTVTEAVQEKYTKIPGSCN